MSEQQEKQKVARSRKRIYEEPHQDDTVREIQENREVNMEAAATGVEDVAAECAEAQCNAAAAVAEAECTPAPDAAKQYLDAIKIVHKWSAWSAGAGLVPIPLIDTVAVTTLQLTMLKRLAEFYGIPFNEQRSKSAIAALLGGVHAGMLTGSALKLMPVIGTLSLISMPAVSGALTYAVGRVFIQHFASGGTFLDFDPVTVREFFEESFRKARQGAA